MSWRNRSLEDIEQKIPQMKFAADCLAEGNLAPLSHLDGLRPSSMTFPDQVSLFVHDRVIYYCRMIEVQDQAQRDSIERVQTLRDLFGFYANQILAGDVSKVMIDLQQQQLDVSTLFSLSHSFMSHAKSLAGEDAKEIFPCLIEAESSVSEQLERYLALSKNAKTEDLNAVQSAEVFAPLDNAALVSASNRLELVTMRCGNNDITLAGANLDLFALLAQESYFWQKNLAENSSLVFGEAIKPIDDLEHHAELLKIALERVSIYATRGRRLLDLSSEIADCVLDIQEEAALLDSLNQNQGPLYSPR